MRSRAGAGLLLVALCSLAAACGSGVYGAAVVAQSPNSPTATSSESVTVSSSGSARAFGGPDNLVANGSFEHGVAPWLPIPGSELELTRSPRRFGHVALLVRARKVVPPLGAKSLIVGHPRRNSMYRFASWAEGSVNLVGNPLVIQLQVLASNAHTWTGVTTLRRPLASGWHRYSLSGTVRPNRAIALRVVVFVKNSVTLNSWLALDGVVARRVTAAGTASRS
jgi:hypothetical protein